MALQVKTVGRVRENTELRAVAAAPSRSPPRIRDWTLLWRVRRWPTSDDVESGRRGAFGSGGGRGPEVLRRAYNGGSRRRWRFAARWAALKSICGVVEKRRVKVVVVSGGLRGKWRRRWR